MAPKSVVPDSTDPLRNTHATHATVLERAVHRVRRATVGDRQTEP
jgi:hypothetical protein